MAEDPDAPWKPGYTGPEPVPAMPSPGGDAPAPDGWGPPSPTARPDPGSAPPVLLGGSGAPVDDPFSPSHVVAEDDEVHAVAATDGSPTGAIGRDSPGDESRADETKEGESPGDESAAPRWDQMSSSDEPPPARSRGRVVGVVVVVVAALVVAIAVVQTTLDRDGDVSSADASIPESVEQWWEWAAADGQSVDEMVVAGETAVVMITTRGGILQRLVGLDVRTGEVRWERDDVDDRRGVRLVDGNPDVVVIQAGFDEGRTAGLDPSTGETIWERTDQGSFAYVPPGADVVVESSFEGSSHTTFVDARTGDELAEVDGALATTNFEGDWLLVDESSDELILVDLQADVIEPTLLGPAGDTDQQVLSGAAIIGDRAFVIDDGAWTELLPGGERNMIVVVDERQDAIGDELVVDGIMAGGSSVGGFGVGADRGVVLAGEEPNQVIGVHLDGNELVVDWSRPVFFVNLHITDRGVLIEGADQAQFGWTDSDDGDAPAEEINRSYLIDGRTGESVVVWERPTGFDSTRAASNGLVVLEPGENDFSTDLVGYRSDGESLWRIEGDVRTAVVGDGVVVAMGRFGGYETVVRGFGP